NGPLLRGGFEGSGGSRDSGSQASRWPTTLTPGVLAGTVRNRDRSFPLPDRTSYCFGVEALLSNFVCSPYETFLAACKLHPVARVGVVQACEKARRRP